MDFDALALGVSGTVDALRHMLIKNFALHRTAEDIGADEPLFAGGVGLDSLQGLNLVMLVERHFGVYFNDLETSVEEISTLSRLARYLIRLRQQASRGPGSTATA